MVKVDCSHWLLSHESVEWSITKAGTVWSSSGDSIPGNIPRFDMELPLQTTIHWLPRLAREEDIPALEALIPLSVRTLQAPHYSRAQIEAALGPVYGVDRQLIGDGTYFVVERARQVIGCGGWSRRQSLYGGDRDRT